MMPASTARCCWLIVAAAAAHLTAVAAAQLILPTPQDVRFDLNWLEMAAERGVLQVYSWPDEEFQGRHPGEYNANYPPLFFWIYYPGYRLAIARDVWPAWPSVWINVFFRLPIALGQWLLFVVIFCRAEQTNPPGVFRAFLLFGANPALLLAGPVWGQIDVLLWGLMYLSLTAQAAGRDGCAGIWAALAALLKPQFLLFVPLVGWDWLRKPQPGRIGRWALGFAVIALPLVSPFLLAAGWDWLRASYQRVFGTQSGAVTTTAFNLWWCASREFGLVAFDSDVVLGLTCKQLGMLSVAGVGGAAGLLYAFGSPRPVMGLASVHLLVCFLALTGQSERFLVLAAASVAAWAVTDRRLLGPALLLSSLQVINLMHNSLYQPKSRWFGLVPPGAARTVPLIAVTFTLAVLAWIIFAFLRPSPKEPLQTSTTHGVVT